ncbi:hypothetical protein [Desulfuribacillus alkaliarsenatis]|uniref:hypothetical protein n=1 Tax=Desulfuribacillus alkaliarsenatis TaxID=766136 RepID=UPI00159F341B|nr:hypothetical protein [Desulfuribacillus alkaliarsenatis]
MDIGLLVIAVVIIMPLIALSRVYKLEDTVEKLGKKIVELEVKLEERTKEFKERS